MIRKIAVAAIAGLLLSSQVAAAAEGAHVASVQGSVMVNQNGRYVPVTSSTVLKAGDRVMSMDGAASISYADGCNVSVSARSMATVGGASPCASGSNGVVRVSTNGGGADGYGGQPTSNVGGSDMWWWLGFGVLTVGVTAWAVSDDDSPSSP